MWHAYNIIAIGDTVKASTIRKVNSKILLSSAEHFTTMIHSRFKMRRPQEVLAAVEFARR